MKNVRSWLRMAALAITPVFAIPAHADLSEILASGKVKIAIGENFAPFLSLIHI